MCLCLHLVGFLGSITLPSLAIEPQGTKDGSPSSYDQLEGRGVESSAVLKVSFLGINYTLTFLLPGMVRVLKYTRHPLRAATSAAFSPAIEVLINAHC